jgi:hypothetical protein
MALAYFAYGQFRAGSKPSASQVEPALAQYLGAGRGACTVSHLSDISVGDFSEQFGGWPIYASHEETCEEGNTTTTFSGLDHAKQKVAAAFARRGASGNIELFVPQLFQDARQQMNQELQQQLPSAGN